MSSVFLSYARADVAIAEDLAKFLTQAGYDVWWDVRLVGSDQFRDAIQEQLQKAAAVVVVWSDNSAASRFVRQEADEALHYRKLVSTRIRDFDVRRIPLGFREQHADYVDDQQKILLALHRLGARPVLAVSVVEPAVQLAQVLPEPGIPLRAVAEAPQVVEKGKAAIPNRVVLADPAAASGPRKIEFDDPHAQTGPAEAETTRVRTLTGVWRWLLILATAATIFLCINQQFTLRFFIGYTQLNTEYFYLLIACMLPFTFLIFPASSSAPLDRVPWYDIALFLATLAAASYLMTSVRQAAELGWEFAGAPMPVIAAGFVLWVLLMEGLRRTGGWSLLLSVLPFTVYPLFADQRWLGPLRGQQSTLEQATAYHTLSNESVLGIPVQAFADTVIGFLVFGTALMMTGAGKFFINLAFALCGTFRGGAAKVGIFASGLLGMMSGSIVSNVLTAGTMTIPVMKRTGFRASYAGAIEACASTGAVLAPPVMGATAFVIAQFLNISYAEVAVAAIIPALLYYVGLFMQVDAYAARNNLRGIPRAELPSIGTTLKEGWYYVFVIALLIVMLLHFKRESHAPFYATALLLVLNQLFSKETRWTLSTIPRFLEVNGRTFVELIAILAGCGLLIGAFSMTGVVSSLANDLLRLAGNNVFLLLAMCALTSLVLGLGLTTTACYIFLAILVAPALEKLGLNKMAVHMFIFYWGMLSSITPPVAIASFAAAGIAGAPAMKTGWESMRVGSIIYFIPFFFVLAPSLLLQGDSPYLEAIGLTALAIAGTLCICGGIQGFQAGIGDLRKAGVLEWPLRFILIVAGFILATPGGGILPFSQVQVTGTALALLVPALLLAIVLVRRGERAEPENVGLRAAP